MFWIVKNLWLITALPFLAAGLSAVLPQRQRLASATLAIGSMIGACLLSVWALGHAIGQYTPNGPKEFYNFTWLQFAAGDGRGCCKLVVWVS